MRSGNAFISVNPATEQVIAEYEPLSDARLREKIAASMQAFRAWSKVPVPERAQRLTTLKQRLEQDETEFAGLMTREMGKPIREARGEIRKCASLCAYYADRGSEFLAPERVTDNQARSSEVRFEPLGPVLAVMPWNFPFWQVLRFAVPGLLAGNTCLLKHATNVLGAGQCLEKLMLAAGFPEGVFLSLEAGHASLPLLLESPEVKAVTLTGSETAGRSIAELAGRNLKKCVLELGGSDPFIVLPDADLELAVSQAVESRTLNSGQSCIAAKRFLVDASLYDEFVERMTAQMQSLPTGDPSDEQTRVGPLARRDLRDGLQQQVQQTLQAGAVLTTGGQALDRPGWFYAPTVLKDVTPEMTAFREELFGPVAAVTRVSGVKEAIQLANLSSFGLGASLWTQDEALARTLIPQLEAGAVFVNKYTASDQSLPFGGVKNSGYGRELSRYGIREFVNIKSVWIN